LVYGVVSQCRTGVDRVAAACGASPTGQEATMSITRRIHRPITACVLVAFAMTSAAAASAPQQDLRSPDARDAAAGRGTVNAPDAITSQVFTDRQRAIVEGFKRSPSYHEARREAATVVKPPQPAPVLADDGIDWGDAGIGAGSLLGVIALGLAAAVTILHRRRRAGRTATVA
jgi:hypothetical protein